MEDFNLNPSHKELGLKPESLANKSSIAPTASVGSSTADCQERDDCSSHPSAASTPSDLCAFVDQHYDRTYAYCYRLSGQRSDAEDLCQQVFVAAVRHLGQIRSLESAQAWLATTARRLYWQSLKESSRQTTLLHSQLNEPESAHEPCEYKLEREDWVHQALAQLNPLARIIVVMYYFEDKSYQHIAQELDIPMGTVMSRLSRSKEMLREALLKAAEPVSMAKSK